MKTNYDETIDKIKQEMIDSFKYIKPYNGNWQKGEKYRRKITFYNEREWRYSPLINEHPVLSGIIKENKKVVKKINEELKRNIIKFEVKHIKYIVIKSKKYIPAISEAVQNMPDINEQQKNELMTKIISFEEIREDFG